ncbi:MAG: hypothetical protein AAB562_03160 [Patescibacteria group bacterium]
MKRRLVVGIGMLALLATVVTAVLYLRARARTEAVPHESAPDAVRAEDSSADGGIGSSETCDTSDLKVELRIKAKDGGVYRVSGDISKALPWFGSVMYSIFLGTTLYISETGREDVNLWDKNNDDRVDEITKGGTRWERGPDLESEFLKADQEFARWKKELCVEEVLREAVKKAKARTPAL